MVVRKVWLLPVAASLCGFAAIISGLGTPFPQIIPFRYVIGVLSGHFPAILPFIRSEKCSSDTFRVKLQ